MIVYVEAVFAENSLLDGLLLYLSVKCARGKVSLRNLLVAASLGGIQAVIFPLLDLPVWAAYPVKFLGGTLLAVVVVRKGNIRQYLITVAVFFLLTFALGGLLTAVYSFFGIETADGTGFYVERAPVALVFSVAMIFLIAVLKGSQALYRHRRIEQNIFVCVLEHGEKKVVWRGFADSGNCLQFRGRPVGVISATGAFALFGAHPKAVGRIRVGTVNGGTERPVFSCERLRVDGRIYSGVYLTIGDVGTRYQLLLHTAWTEANNEHTRGAQTMAKQSAGRRERYPLSLRERGAPSSAIGGGGRRIAHEDGTRRGGGDGQGEADRT